MKVPQRPAVARPSVVHRAVASVTGLPACADELRPDRSGPQHTWCASHCVFYNEWLPKSGRLIELPTRRSVWDAVTIVAGNIVVAVVQWFVLILLLYAAYALIQFKIA